MRCSLVCNSAAGHFAAVVRWALVLMIPALLLTFASTAARAQCGGGACSEDRSGCGQRTSLDHNAGSDHQSQAHHDMQRHGDGTQGAHAQQTPHGGQITMSQWYHFETVYTTKETRLYLYSKSRQRMDAQGVRGDVVMQVRGNPRLHRYTAEVAEDDRGKHYLSVPVDVSGIRDGDMLVTYALVNLPVPEEPTVAFSQVFALTQIPGLAAGPQRAAAGSDRVRVASLTDADRALIARQRTCPVLGSTLGDHGDPLKILVGGDPLFVCCSGCVDRVQENPDRYLAKVAENVPGF